MPKGILRPAANLSLLCFTVFIDSPKYLDLSSPALSQKKITVGRGANQPVVVQPSRIEVNFESRQRLWPCVFRAWNHFGLVESRLAGKRLRKIRQSYLPEYTGLLLAIVGVGRFAGDSLVRTDRGRQQQNGRAQKHQ